MNSARFKQPGLPNARLDRGNTLMATTCYTAMTGGRLLRRVTVGIFAAILLQGCGSEGDGSSTGPDTGTGGSTARMTIVDDYLYAIANNEIQLFDISTPAVPNPWVRVPVDWNIETLFPYEDYLLIGAADGLHIMDNSDPASPEYIADFSHAQAQDPVVAMGDYAYVTLRSNSGGPNELNIIDISDIRNPREVNTYAMQFPGGLAVTQEKLFICDGLAGLKIFDRADPVELAIAEVIPGVDCRDVIVQQDTLYVITENRFIQYDHETSPPMLMSEIFVR